MMGSDGKLCSLARRLPPAVRPGSYQAADRCRSADWYRSTARGLGTPALKNILNVICKV